MSHHFFLSTVASCDKREVVKFVANLGENGLLPFFIFFKKNPAFYPLPKLIREMSLF